MNYIFCRQCEFYLDAEKDYDATNYDNVVWCSFFWALFSNRQIQIKYGQEFIWRLIPKEWRHWWLGSLTAVFPNVYNNIAIEFPTPFFNDKTIDIKEWDDEIQTYFISNLATICNKHLRPTIKCPWGCSEFQHKVGYLPIDVIIQRLLQKAVIKIHTKIESGFEKRVLSIREDYIRDEDGDEQDFLLFNPEWAVVPSIAFVDGRGPMVLTCSDHNNGSNLFMIHPCRWHHSLASNQPDQLCQAVIQPRTLKPIKASKYSIGFQMFHQAGSFSGIDTCSATSYGRFDFNSKLIREAEARSIRNRPDINLHLSKLREENVISQYIEDGRKAFALTYQPYTDYRILAKGATYVSLEASIILQNENTNRNISAWIDNNNEDRPPIQISFQKYWSNVLYPCQNMSDYGVRFPKVPILLSYDRNTRLIWKVCALISRVETLWKMICNYHEFRSSNWHGWFLTFIYKNCFNEAKRRQWPSDPFKVKTNAHFIEKVQRHMRLHSYFDDEHLRELHYFDMPSDFDGKVFCL